MLSRVGGVALDAQTSINVTHSFNRPFFKCLHFRSADQSSDVIGHVMRYLSMNDIELGGRGFCHASLNTGEMSSGDLRNDSLVDLDPLKFLDLRLRSSNCTHSFEKLAMWICCWSNMIWINKYYLFVCFNNISFSFYFSSRDLSDSVMFTYHGLPVEVGYIPESCDVTRCAANLWTDVTLPSTDINFEDANTCGWMS